MRRFVAWLTVCSVMLAMSCSPEPVPRTIVFLSDFGTDNDAAAICRAVMHGVAPSARIEDLTHQVPPYDVAEAARDLESVSALYPAGTVFVTVVDPGVGTGRRALVALTHRGQYFVLPDNGLLTLVADRDTLVAARAIVDTTWLRPGARSTTFHGRDVFAPVAAHLANGRDYRSIGPLADSLVRIDVSRARVDSMGIVGQVFALDRPYGNLITDIPAELFLAQGHAIGTSVVVELVGQRRTVPFVRTFGDVPEGTPLAYVDSRGRIALALNLGDASKAWGVVPPVRVRMLR